MKAFMGDFCYKYIWLEDRVVEKNWRRLPKKRVMKQNWERKPERGESNHEQKQECVRWRVITEGINIEQFKCKKIRLCWQNEEKKSARRENKIQKKPFAVLCVLGRRAKKKKKEISSGMNYTKDAICE